VTEEDLFAEWGGYVFVLACRAEVRLGGFSADEYHSEGLLFLVMCWRRFRGGDRRMFWGWARYRVYGAMCDMHRRAFGSRRRSVSAIPFTDADSSVLRGFCGAR
jgi:hypothetical protein